jgi:cell division protein FtsA
MVSYGTLREIIQPRAHELLELIQAELERSGHLQQLGAGLVLVGGGARQRDLVPLAEQKLSLPVRVGNCTGLENMGDQLVGPEYAALTGLVIYGNRRRLLRDSKETGLWARLRGALKSKGGKWQSA